MPHSTQPALSIPVGMATEAREQAGGGERIATAGYRITVPVPGPRLGMSAGHYHTFPACCANLWAQVGALCV